MTDLPTVHRWADLPTDAPMAKLVRQRVIGQRAMLSRVELEQGCYVPTHRHDNEQFVCLLEGKARFGLGEQDHPGAAGESVIVHAGEVLHLPPNTPHAAEAIERCVMLDIFSPPSARTGIDRD